MAPSTRRRSTACPAANSPPRVAHSLSEAIALKPSLNGGGATRSKAAAHAGESERPSRRDARVHARARGALSERALAACAPESGQTYSPWGGPARVAMRAARRARAARGPALAAAACAAAGLAATCAALEASSDDPATVVAAALASGPGSCALVTSLLVGDEIALTLPGGGGEAPFALANDALRELLCANRIPRAAPFPHDDKPAAQVRQAAVRRRTAAPLPPLLPGVTFDVERLRSSWGRCAAAPPRSIGRARFAGMEAPEGAVSHGARPRRRRAPRART